MCCRSTDPPNKVRKQDSFHKYLEKMVDLKQLRKADFDKHMERLMNPGQLRKVDPDEPPKKKPRWDVAAPILPESVKIPEQQSMSPPPPPPQSELLPGFAELDSFFKSLDAATTGIPTPAEKLSHLKEQAEAMRIEEEEAIKSLIAANEKSPKTDEGGFTAEEEMAMIEHIAATDRIDTLSDEEKFYIQRKAELDEELKKMKKEEPEAIIRLPLSPIMDDDENKENIPPEKKEDLEGIEFVGEKLNNIPVFTI
jgi:hypothetical protein